MGSVGGLLGMSGGQGGTGFSTNAGTNAQQLQGAFNGQQAAMGNQNSLLSALQGQNGLGNQSQVYNQQQAIANGQGPNPAQAMLNQATGANVANQAALMAGQRGAGANVGLMARQAGQQGMQAQQQAAGQGASMEAQQALGALGQAGQMANTMAGQQIGQTNQNVASQQNEQSVLQGANTANNQIQGQLANTTMQGQQGLMGGVMNGAGAVAGIVPKAYGGEIKYADGGAVGPQSMFGQSVLGSIGQNVSSFGGSNPGAEAMANSMKGNVKPKDPMAGATTLQPMAGSDPSMVPVAAGGGKVPAKVSPGEKFLKPGEAKAVAQGSVNPMKVGETIPGKAQVKGDSYKNDTVPKYLEEGGVVVPRSIMMSGDPARGAADFVRAVMRKKGKK